MAEIGIVGLGKMGANMAERLRRAGHEVVGFDHDKESSRDVANLSELVQALPTPRVVWVMVPAGEPTYATVRELQGLLDQGDVMVDGGNSRYTDDQRHAEELAGSGLGFLDVGVSGGVWGLTEGYALMVGGAMRTSRRCSRFSTRSSLRASPVSCMPDRSAPGTSRRWSTTASSTG